jgi:hypothetical protein
MIQETYADEGTLVTLWNKRLFESTIPRAVHFTSNYQNLLVFGLETGKMWVTMLTSYAASDAHCGQVLSRRWDISYKMVQSFEVQNVSNLKDAPKLKGFPTEGMLPSAHQRSSSSLTTWPMALRLNMSPTQPADPPDQACERLTGLGLFKDSDYQIMWSAQCRIYFPRFPINHPYPTADEAFKMSYDVLQMSFPSNCVSIQLITSAVQLLRPRMAYWLHTLTRTTRWRNGPLLRSWHRP